MFALSGTAVAGGYIITSISQIKPGVRHALAGKRGSQGPRGAQGSSGLLGLVTVNGPAASYPPSSYGAPPLAQCPSGMFVVGTGFNGPFNPVGGFVLAYGTFVGGFFANDSSITLNGNVQAICAQLPPGATVARALQSARRRYAADVRRWTALEKAAHR